ncbi:Mg2+ transporter protein, CorA-like/Zinc transport protein ZntB [Dillenia turbinata]|uniref:Magnesium transporter n=1 Tax=Dillenia turbinata TaxID=194707 RepID=A0AAN8VAT8_9MAGN
MASPNILRLLLPPPPSFDVFSSRRSLLPPLICLRNSKTTSLPVVVRFTSSRVRCYTKSTEEDRWRESETLPDDVVEEASDNGKADQNRSSPFASGGGSQRVVTSSTDSLSLGIREPVYEVVEVNSNGLVSTKKINRRQLLKSSGLRPRDIRSIDPSLWLTNSMPSLLVREHAILLNLGSLRAIVMQERVFIFNYNRKGGKAFIDLLLPRLNPKNMNGGPSMPFELEAVEAALVSRIQRLENRLMDLEPRVQALFEVLPNRLTADVLEQLRLSKQTLVELGSRAGALRQMLLDLLEDPHEIRRICIMGRNCTLKKGDDDIECSVPLEKQIAEGNSFNPDHSDEWRSTLSIVCSCPLLQESPIWFFLFIAEEEEEIEMLLENYLQRCESCHGQAERLLDSAREMEDSIAVNLSSRRLELSRVELLLQVSSFCIGVGALIAGIFGMNLKSYLEEHVFAFWLTTAGIIVGAVVAFFLMYSYLKSRKIL